MKLENVNEAIVNGRRVIFQYGGLTLHYTIRGVISRYDRETKSWYYLLELQDIKAPHSITIAKVEDVKIEIDCTGMICKECGSGMRLDTKDRHFKGNYDNYWICDNCLTSCIEEVRFSQSFNEIWHSENNGEVKDYEIKHEIDCTKEEQDVQS